MSKNEKDNLSAKIQINWLACNMPTHLILIERGE